MKNQSRGWWACGFLVVFCLVGAASTARSEDASEGETLGFVVSSWGHRVPETRPKYCPEGVNENETEHFGITLSELRADVRSVGYSEAMVRFLPRDACQDPTVQKDPGFKVLAGDPPMRGLDLDGVHSSADQDGACAHDDFRGPDGEEGIDDQHARLIGCTKGFRQGSWLDYRNKKPVYFVSEGYALLIEVEGVDDRTNDDDVRVRFSSSAEAPFLDVNEEAVPYRSFLVHEEARYRSEPVRGKIEDGVLTTEPVDLRMRFKHEVVDSELYYRDARIRAELTESGLSGLFGGYWDAENLFHIYNDHSIGDEHTGRLAAIARGYMCAGMYHAIDRLADGHPDPETGKCTSLSTMMHFEAVPAFAIHDPE